MVLHLVGLLPIMLAAAGVTAGVAGSSTGTSQNRSIEAARQAGLSAGGRPDDPVHNVTRSLRLASARAVPGKGTEHRDGDLVLSVWPGGSGPGAADR